jgi:Cu+-exporting ATPase
MVALLERAQTERPHIQRAVDRVASVFAPVVLVLATATALGRFALGAGALDSALAAAAVLLVACPCALGLATPAAITAAIGRAARLGILVKRGEALERCARVRHAVMDKTGTLTTGRFALHETWPVPGVARGELLALAAEAEGEATHPSSRARELRPSGPGAPSGCERRTSRFRLRSSSVPRRSLGTGTAWCGWRAGVMPSAWSRSEIPRGTTRPRPWTDSERWTST